MKKHLLLLSGLLLLTSLSAQFRGFKSGLTAGVGVSQFSDNVNEPGAKVSNSLAFEAGLTSAFHFSKNLGLGLDLKFVSLGSRIEGRANGGVLGTNREDYRDTYKLSYIDVPLYAKLNIGLGNLYLSLFAGPSAQFSLKTIQQRDWDGNNEDFEEEIRSGEAFVPAFNYGIGLHAKAADHVFYINLRAQVQADELGQINNVGTKINASFLSVGYLF